MAKVQLKVPSLADIKYRQEWMKDPKTMNYNAGYNMELQGYDYETGTITKTDEEMLNWYNKWINKEPDKFFAYIYTTANTEKLIGEIYFYYDNELKLYDMGILITYEDRGKGYSYDALIELEKIAFEKYGINALSDIIPINRIGAIKTFKKAGFSETNLIKKEVKFKKDEEARQLLITKENYFNK